MPHKFVSRALWHHACEIIYQDLLKFYRQQPGPQLPGYDTTRDFGEGSWDGTKYWVAWDVIKTLSGRNSSLDYASVYQAFVLLDYDPRQHNFSHYRKALNSFRSALHQLDARERRIPDGELLEKVKNTLSRAFGLSNYRNLLYELAQDLIKDRTTAGFAGRHIKSFVSFARPTADIQLLAQQTNVNSSSTKVPIEYVLETSVEWSGQLKTKVQHRTHVTRDGG